jgi:hypothetical protein
LCTFQQADQAAIFAATGEHRSKQAARIAAAPFQRGASSAITLLHPSIKQPVLLLLFCYHTLHSLNK